MRILSWFSRSSRRLERGRSLLQRVIFVTPLVVASAASACAAQRTTPALIVASVGDDTDAMTATAFRALLDQVIGDSADTLCVSVASTDGANVTDADPSRGVLRALHSRGTTILPRSVCAADERNFGNPRGLLRLRDVSRLDDRTLLVHADAVGDHTARYECMVPRRAGQGERARCRMVSRD